jgi:hypothetical protein
MDLNHIVLSDQVIRELYRTVMVYSDEKSIKKEEQIKEKKEQIPVEKKSWKWLGDNKKNILIIVNNRDAVHLPDNDLELLTSILAACKLNLGDVAVLNLQNNPDYIYQSLLDFFSSKIVFLFDVEPASFGLPINFPQFQLQAFANNTFIYSPPLSSLASDKTLKTKLWESLKRLFNI